MRILTCIGDATSPHSWSGTPFYFLKAAQQAGFLDAGWRLDPRRLQGLKMAWNAWRQLRHGEHGGFQYSRIFLHKLQSQAELLPDDAEFLSHFPLFPPPSKYVTSYYIDATLAQNFEDYGLAKDGFVGHRMIADAMEREKDQYAAAKNIVCMGKWAARSVVERYGISPDAVHVVPAGANIERSNISAGSCGEPLFHPLRLGFIGKDWRRKNLLFTLEIGEILHARGIATEVIAAGFPPSNGPRHSLLRAMGYIDRHTNADYFVDFFRRCHFTCLFSSAEAFGLSNRESLFLGTPVLAWDVGGISDTVPAGCGHLFSTDTTAGDVADVIQSYIREPDQYEALRNRIAEQAHTFTWDATVRKLTSVWAGSGEFSYAKVAFLHA